MVAVVVACVLGVGAGVAQAGSTATRATHSVAGVRYTLDEWAKLLLSDQAKAACALLTAHGQKVWAQANSSKNCIEASTGDYKFLKKYPTDAKAIREYGDKEPVTIHGNTATVPKLAGGDRRLLYIHNLWWIDS